jgi:hypothetical protein
VVVRDDKDALADPGPPRGRRKVGVTREWMPSLALNRQIRELDSQKRRPRHVRLQVQVAPRLPLVERVRAVDEPILDAQ